MNWLELFKKREQSARRRLNRHRKIVKISPRERARRRNQASRDRMPSFNPIATELLLSRPEAIVVINTRQTNNLPKNGVLFS